MSNLIYDAMLAHVKTTRALRQVAGLLTWDQEVMMPPKGADSRAEQAAAMETITHQRSCDPQLGEWLTQLEEVELDATSAANVRLIRRSHQRASKIPADLATEIARVTSRAQGIWAQARAANRFKDFSPILDTILKLKREEAACLKPEGDTLYDALLDDFEPGMRVSVLQPLLEGLRPRLSSLRQRIAEARKSEPTLSGQFPRAAQLDLARKVASVLGYDWEAGRLDESTHPFSSGTASDARITTRIDESEPLGCLYSTVHEIGHALYEQGITQDLGLTPVSNHVSLGVHESQSRFWENQVARSRPFCQWLYPYFVAAFGQSGLLDAEDLYRAVNHVETGFVRTESDEVHYNLHVLLRFELERDLISNDLQVADLEQEWNRRFERDFGRKVPDAANGVLQDVHWSVGLFGYFPTYSLGNIYAAQLTAALRDSIPDLDDKLRIGETRRALGWMRTHIHHLGSLYEPDELVKRATGQDLSSDPLLDYLDLKYRELFNL